MCLIVGPRPLFICFITASFFVSSKMYNVACPLKSCALGAMQSMWLNKFGIVF